jgi:hypothetical protein
MIVSPYRPGSCRFLGVQHLNPTTGGVLLLALELRQRIYCVASSPLLVVSMFRSLCFVYVHVLGRVAAE